MPLDQALAQKTFWERAAATVVATTGLINDLSATTTGYARATGSFITDGFAAGMEVAGAGFNAGNNAPSMITGVTTGFLTISGGRTAQGVSAARTLSVGLPVARMRENTIIPNASAPGVRPFISEQWVPATFNLITSPIQGGHVEESGLYVLTWFGLGNVGILALRRSIEAIKARFTPGTIIAVGSDFVRIPASPGPVAGQIIPLENGYTSCQLTIPWRCASVNVVAA